MKIIRMLSCYKHVYISHPSGYCADNLVTFSELGATVELFHTVDTEFSVTNFFCLHFSEHAQWGLPVMSDILVKIFVDISCNKCGLFLL